MIRICSLDIGIEFVIEKCVMLKITKQEREITKKIELPNQESIRTLGGKENYKYIGILEIDTKQNNNDNNLALGRVIH